MHNYTPLIERAHGPVGPMLCSPCKGFPGSGARQCSNRDSFGESPSTTWRFSSRWLCAQPSFALSLFRSLFLSFPLICWVKSDWSQYQPIRVDHLLTEKLRFSSWERGIKLHLQSWIVKSHVFLPMLCLGWVVRIILENRSIEHSQE